MQQSVYKSIAESLGSRVPECGGVLGAGEDGVICEYYFDETGVSKPDAYIPDVVAINRVLEAWHERGIHMVGIVHSHREGLRVPSCGDISYGMRILQALDTVDEFYLPILTRDGDDVRLDGYVVAKQDDRVKVMGVQIILN